MSYKQLLLANYHRTIDAQVCANFLSKTHRQRHAPKQVQQGTEKSAPIRVLDPPNHLQTGFHLEDKHHPYHRRHHYHHHYRRYYRYRHHLSLRSHRGYWEKRPRCHQRHHYQHLNIHSYREGIGQTNSEHHRHPYQHRSRQLRHHHLNLLSPGHLQRYKPAKGSQQTGNHLEASHRRSRT